MSTNPHILHTARRTIPTHTHSQIRITHLPPIRKHSLTFPQPRQLGRLGPHKPPLPSIPRLFPRLYRHHPIKVQIPRRLATLTHSSKRRLEDIPRRPRRRPRRVSSRIKEQHKRINDAEEKHADEPRREALQPARHGARVDAEDADARGSPQARLELVLHHDQEELGGGVPAVPAAEARVLGRGAPGARGDGAEGGGVGDDGLVPRVVKGFRGGVSGVVGAGVGRGVG